MLEIEKKYLIKQRPDLITTSSSEIEQGYLSFKPEIRIRKDGNKYFITQKDDGTLVRKENETEIDSIAYSILTNMVQGRIIEKTRYKIPIDNSLIAELDVFHGEYKGLMIVEVEFPTKEDADKFIPPFWFGEEITENNKFKNKNLAQIEPREILDNLEIEVNTEKKEEIKKLRKI